jgi:hypothetical protein
VSLGLKHVTLPDGSQMAFRVELSFLVYSAPGLSQQTQPEDSSLPQYDLHAETEIKRVMNAVNLLSLGTRRAFGEPIIKNGDDKVHIYLSMRQTISRGDGHPSQFKGKARLVRRRPRSRTGEGHGHAFAPRRQGQAGVALASQQVSTGKEAR